MVAFLINFEAPALDQMDEKKDIRIIDIAKMAGVSIGTVDRVIHNRGKVSEEKLQKVNAVLSIVNYKPNIFARSLVSKRSYKLIALIPSYSEDDYWMYITEGLDKAAAEIRSSSVSFEKLFFDQYDKDSFKEAIQKLLEMEFDGVIIANFFKESVVTLSKTLDTKKIPYVYIDTNIEDQNHLAYFGTNSYDSGLVAAQIMLGSIGISNDILIAKMFYKNYESSNQVAIRERGFLDQLAKLGFEGKIYYASLKVNSPLKNFETLDGIFNDHPENKIEGGITFNSTCHVMANYLKVRNKKLSYLVGYDLIRKNTSLLKDGTINLLIGQRPELQGYKSVKVLHDKLLLNVQTDKINYMPIDLLIKENIDYYQNM